MSDNFKIDNEKGTILVRNVRLSHPHLFVPTAMEEGKEKKYKMSAILPVSTHKQAIQAIQGVMMALMQKELKERIGNDRLFLRNGDNTGKPEYAGAWVLSAGDKIRPQVIDRDRSPIREEDDKVYGGCYVNVLVRPWVQNHPKYGKRINANLVAVQFVRDGERFGLARPDINEHFEDETGEENGGDFNRTGSDDGFGFDD